MKFFDRLRGAREKAEEMDPESRRKLLEAWGLEEDATPAAREAAGIPVREAAPDGSSPALAYDRSQWHRRLKTVLAELPDTEDDWEHVVSDAKAKGFDPIWVTQTMMDEFVLMVREAVADRVFTERERKKLDLARQLIGLTEAQADAVYQRVISEAEAFFGGAVEEI